MKELIHFAHGNGFPSLCYKQVLDRLSGQYDYCYIDKIGHNPAFPVSENWSNLIAEVIASIEKQADRPVIAVGHSLGGVLSLLAAIERPELFKTVILLDSPLIGPLKSLMVRLAKALGFIDKVTPAHLARGRRQHWKNREQLIQYLQARAFFSTFAPECLEDYINYGLEEKEGGYYLRFDRQIEYQIYRTIPHTIHGLKGKLIVPAALIYGDKSSVVSASDRHYMESHFNVQCFKTKGTHLFPLEHPKAAAEQIISALNAII